MNGKKKRNRNKCGYLMKGMLLKVLALWCENIKAKAWHMFIDRSIEAHILLV